MFRRVTGFFVMLCAFLLISVGLLPFAPATLYAADFKVLVDSSGIEVTTDGPGLVVDNMVPGDIEVATLEVVNESSVHYNLALSADVREGDGPLYETLTVVIRGEDVVYSGPLSGLQDTSLGSFAAGTTRSFQMEITLPADAGNEYQGMEVGITFTVSQLPDGSDPPVEPGTADPPDDGDKPSGDTPGSGLPVTGTNLDLLLPMGLVLFLIGLMILGSARKEHNQVK